MLSRFRTLHSCIILTLFHIVTAPYDDPLRSDTQNPAPVTYLANNFKTLLLNHFDPTSIVAILYIIPHVYIILAHLYRTKIRTKLILAFIRTIMSIDKTFQKFRFNFYSTLLHIKRISRYISYLIHRSYIRTHFQIHIAIRLLLLIHTVFQNLLFTFSIFTFSQIIERAATHIYAYTSAPYTYLALQFNIIRNCAHHISSISRFNRLRTDMAKDDEKSDTKFDGSPLLLPLFISLITLACDSGDHGFDADTLAGSEPDPAQDAAAKLLIKKKQAKLTAYILNKLTPDYAATFVAYASSGKLRPGTDTYNAITKGGTTDMQHVRKSHAIWALLDALSAAAAATANDLAPMLTTIELAMTTCSTSTCPGFDPTDDASFNAVMGFLRLALIGLVLDNPNLCSVLYTLPTCAEVLSKVKDTAAASQGASRAHAARGNNGRNPPAKRTGEQRSDIACKRNTLKEKYNVGAGCPDAKNCRFSHTIYTRECRYGKDCRSGARCQFIHPPADAPDARARAHLAETASTSTETAERREIRSLHRRMKELETSAHAKSARAADSSEDDNDEDDIFQSPEYKKKVRMTCTRPTNAFFARSYSAKAYALASKWSNDYWIVDSGASDHITNDPNDCITRAVCHKRVEGIDPSRPLIATAFGSTHFCFKNASYQASRTLIIPKASAKLFSLNRAIEDGCTVSPKMDKLCFPNGQHTKIHRIDGVRVIIPSLTGFASADAKAALGKTTDKRARDEDFQKPFAALHFAKLLFHLRLFHANDDRCTRTQRATIDAPRFHKHEKLDDCDACRQGGMHHKPVHKSRQNEPHRSDNARLLHSDWWGPYKNLGPNKERFIQVFIDDISGYVWTFASPRKDCGAKNLRAVQADIRELFGDDTPVKVSAVQADYDTTYKSGKFAEWCDIDGIKQRFSAPYTPQHNGRSERFWRTMENSIASNLCYSGCNVKYWTHALTAFTHSHNRTVASTHTLTPYELLTKRRPSVANLKVFGCPVLAYLEPTDRAKFTSKCRPGINLGPDPETMDSFFIYFPDTRRIHSTRHASFDELWRERTTHYQRLQKKFPTTELYASEKPKHPAAQRFLNPTAYLKDPEPDEPDELVPLTPQNETTEPDARIVDTGRSAAAGPSTRNATDADAVDFLTETFILNKPFDIADRGEFEISRAPDGTLLDGPNTNTADKRTVPITLARSHKHKSHDSRDIYAIEKPSSSGRNPRYLTIWAPSFNITKQAIKTRLTDHQPGQSSFKIKHARQSVYDPNNYDVVWDKTKEPRSAFLDNQGRPLDTLSEFLSSDRNKKNNASRQTRHFAALAFFTSLVPAILPDYSDSRFDSYEDANAPVVRAFAASQTPRKENPAYSLKTATKFLNANSETNAFAFISVALPTGSTPRTLKEAFASVDAKHWRFATSAEVDQLESALTWELVPRSEAPNVISGKWVFRIKKDQDGNIDRYKARWVARGFTQKHGVDFTEIFAPTIKAASVRLLLALANYYDIDLHGLDVSNAFARADIDGDIFIEQPHGYVKKPDNDTDKPKVCKLKKALYGTKQAARLWHVKFRSHLIKNGWRAYESDPCIFSRHSAKFGHEFLGVYVDDIIHAGSAAAHKSLLTSCNTQFPTTSQGPLTWILAMQITRDRKSRTLCLHQTQGIVDYIDEWKLHDSDIRTTPMSPKWKYGDGPETHDESRIRDYRSQVGSLNYFATSTRPDIALAVGLLCRHLHNPNEQCFKALQHVNSYIAHTPHLGLIYRASASGNPSIREISGTEIPQPDPPELTDESPAPTLRAFSDATYGGETADGAKSTSGSLIYFDTALIAWCSSKQPVISLSSMEAEQIAAFETSRSIVYFRQFLKELGLQQTSPTIIHEDNTGCIASSKNPIKSRRVRHMHLRYHYLRDIIHEQKVVLEYIKTTDQIADILTKPLPEEDFKRFLPFLVRQSPITSSSSSTSTPSKLPPLRSSLRFNRSTTTSRVAAPAA
jgi:transposase InsO family protein